MKFIETEIEDLIIIEPIVFEDMRGYFLNLIIKISLKIKLVKLHLLRIMSQNL